MTEPTRSTGEAVLLMGFNRPESLRTVIDRVRDARPPRVYLAVDGPRRDRPSEAGRVEACRQLFDALDWGCEVRTLFQPENLGCGRGVSTAISWFFEHEERGIILEDDILVDPTFFPFCAELLDRYETDERVFAISGTNFVPPEAVTATGSYRFTHVPIVWGWATWRRSWEKYRFDLAGWRRWFDRGQLWRIAGRNLPAYLFWSLNFDLLARHAIDTWDIQVVNAAMRTNGLVAVSNVNLVENSGFTPEATHTHRRPNYLREVEAAELPVQPSPVEIDRKAEAWQNRYVYDATAPGLMRQAGRGLRRFRRR